MRKENWKRHLRNRHDISEEGMLRLNGEPECEQVMNICKVPEFSQLSSVNQQSIAAGSTRKTRSSYPLLSTFEMVKFMVNALYSVLN